ncbi:ATP-binding protein [Vibrio fluvialis]|uniref:ATP-binding protein n=1 Tax=Vibrio fluvialis TaxID=676 RepID=UPI001EEBA918|nr:ATP-binding protein [Vibrio fluvialis]MCG6400681.1 AAA family ATPase [Vibrio fluvialis]
MYQITEFKHEKRIVPLTIPNESDYQENTFTVIVGKNGVGKSRLLSSMVSEFVIHERVPSRYEILGDIHPIDRNEGLVIAVSTSPFDKFKMPPKNRFKDSIVSTNYRYIGMRSGGPYGASAISLISSATKGILDRFLRNESYDRLRDVFNTLGFLPEVQLIFKPNFSSKRYIRIDEISYSKSHVGVEWFDDLGIEVNSRIMENLNEINANDVYKIRKAIANLGELFISEKAISIDLDFAHGEAFSINKAIFHNLGFLESINILLNFNLIRLMDLKLHKAEYGDMSLRRASSGEQCMLVMMLGIAGHICDNSLIFIDEPEISLHPKWQEEFMSLLVRTFSKYRACQFFIATHSPQIVSRLKGNNCFVTSLTKNEIYSSSHFYERSSDFQLAELFDAPGSRNEYITRLAFALLSKVKSKKNVQESEMKELARLLELCNSISHDDPIFDLIKSVEEVVQYYASYK